MEVNNELIPLVDVDELDAKRNEFSVDTLQSGFNRTVETGLGRSYDHVDRLANDEIIKNLPDYNENKEVYDSYLDLLPEQKDVYRSAIEKGAYTIGSDGEVVAADGITMMGRLLTKKGGFFKEDALKGIILANAQGVSQTTLDDKFKEIHTNNIKKYQNQTFTTAGAAADMIGSLGAYFTEPEIALEIFGVPSRIFGKTIVGNAAKAFGYEAGVASVSEAIRQFKPTGVMALNKRAKVDYTLADGGMHVLVNAGFAGTLRGLGSGIQDTLLLNTIKSRTPDADAYAVFSRWNERQLSKTILNQTAYDVSMRTLSEELNKNRMPEIETDINIMERASPDIQAVNIQEEARLQRSEMGYNNFAKAFDKEFDAIPTTPVEFKFEDDLVDSFDKLDPEIMNHPEVQQLKRELDAFDTTPETIPPYKLDQVEIVNKKEVPINLKNTTLKKQEQNVSDDFTEEQKLMQKANTEEGNYLRQIKNEVSNLYRETNLDGLSNLLYSNNAFGHDKYYFASHPHLALGQGKNKGIIIKVRPDLQGKENMNKPYIDDNAKEYVISDSNQNIRKNITEIIVDRQYYETLNRRDKKEIESLFNMKIVDDLDEYRNQSDQAIINKKELDAFDTTPETIPPYKLEEVEGILKYSPQGKILISDVIQLEKGTNIQGVRSAIERTQQGKATARDTEIVDAVDNYMRNEGFKHITPEELPKDLIDEGYSLSSSGEFLDPTGKVLFAKGGDNVLAGGIAAIGEDEEGNITFDPAKFLAGALGLQVAKKFAPKLFEIADDGGVRIGSGAGGKAPTTEPKNLLVTHNISESSLLKAEQSGGLIAPSLAVIKAEKGGTLKGYGDITLLGKKDLVDPQKNQTTVLSDADIYSPRVPQPIHTVDKKAWDNFVDKYDLDNIFSQNKYKYMKDEEGNREEVLRKVKNDIRLKKDFLNEQGVSIQNKTKLDVSSNLAKDITKKVMTDAGITKKIIDGVNTTDYDIMKKQVTDIYNNIKGELYKNIEPDVRKTLLKNKGYNYDDNGVLTFAAAETLQRDLKNIINNVQKFDERATNIDIDSKFTKERTKEYDTWLDDKINNIFGYKKLSTGASYTPQNIVDYMFRSGTVGKEEKGIFGNSKNAGEIRAVASRMLTSIEDVTKNKYKLVSYDDMKPIQDDFSNRLFDLTSKMGGDSFDGKEAASKAIFNYAKTGSLSGIKTSFKDDVKKFVNDIKNAETQYFEAKLKRVVKASEFEIAVIPKGTDKKVIDYLKSEGLKIKLYDKSVTGADEDTIIKAATSGKILFMHPAAIAGGLGLGIISQENNKDK